MNRHLSAERISLWMLGERSAEDEQHVRECTECAIAVTHLETGLANFRSSAEQWSERQSNAAAVRDWAPARPANWAWRFRWAAVAAVVLLVMAIPLYRFTRHSETGVTIGQSDVQLLEEVDAEVSRTVPQPMEPLLTLMAWDSESGTGTTGKENHETKQQR